MVMHLGLKTYVFTACAIIGSSWFESFKAPIADWSARRQHVFPPPVGPTVITPKRTLSVWYSSMVFTTNLGTTCKPARSSDCSHAPLSAP